MKVTDAKPGCLEKAIAVLGDKWTPLLVRELSGSPLSFCQIEVALEGISPRTLSQRLDRLETEKIVYKRMYCEHPPRHKYELTKKGEDLQGVLAQMSAWGAKYN